MMKLILLKHIVNKTILNLKQEMLQSFSCFISVVFCTRDAPFCVRGDIYIYIYIYIYIFKQVHM